MADTYKDASQLYPVERRSSHAAREGFRINELQIAADQEVPWHFHTNIQDTFYVLDGAITISLREPEATIHLAPQQTYSVERQRPHRVTNGGSGSATFLVLQGIGEYDYVPLD